MQTLHTQQISKHPGYLKDCGISLELILRTMKILTILQQINSTINKEIQNGKQEEKSAASKMKFLQSDLQDPSQISFQTIPFLKQQQKSEKFMLNSIKQFTVEQNEQIYERIDFLIQEIHHQYVSYHNNILTLTFIYAKYRFYDIYGKFSAHRRRYQKFNDKKVYLNIEKNLYLKSYFLEEYLKHSRLYFNQIAQSYPIANYYLTNPSKDFQQLNYQVSNVRIQTQLDYSKKNKISGSRAVKQLRNLVHITSIKSFGRPFLLGFWLATVLLMLSIIIFLIVYFDINFNTSNNFQTTFPVWRGLSYFIYYFWLMGINTYIFNYFKVNFYLFTAFNNFHLPSPSEFFICAAMFTSIHLFLFLIYLISLAQNINIRLEQAQQEFLPGISWLFFLGFFLLPLKNFYFRERFYPILMLGRSILAPIFGVEFKFQWFVDVLISFRQPLRDIMYTFTYYFIDHTVVYRNTIMYETIAGLILFSIRILQNSRAMYQNRKFGGVPLWGITRSLLNSITMITSYLSRTNDNGQNFYLYFWLVIALITTLFSYYVDLRNDWAFLDPNHGYLRAKLLYRNKKFYYFVIVLNLLLRFVWTMNISPDIIRRLPVKPYIVVMVLSCLQITRRCIWMIFRVQRQHINAQQQLDNLFILEKHSQIELQFIEQQKQITIKSPNWLKISIDPQEEIKKSRLADFRLENEQNMLNLEKKLQRAENIINILTTEPQKCCGKSQN